MKCPICKNEMQLTGQDTSYGVENKKYQRQRFNCEQDDVWMVLEVPKNKE